MYSKLAHYPVFFILDYPRDYCYIPVHNTTDSGANGSNLLIRCLMMEVFVFFARGDFDKRDAALGAFRSNMNPET